MKDIYHLSVYVCMYACIIYVCIYLCSMYLSIITICLFYYIVFHYFLFYSIFMVGRVQCSVGSWIEYTPVNLGPSSHFSMLTGRSPLREREAVKVSSD